MNEQRFLWDAFLTYTSSKSAHNDFFSTPFDDPDALSQEYLICNEALQFLQLVITPSFEELPDIRSAVQHCTKGLIPSCLEVFTLYKSLLQWENLDVIAHNDFPLLKTLYQETPLPPLKKYFLNTFEADGTLADTASPELKRIRNLKHSLRRRIEKFLQASFQSDDIAEKILSYREGRYVLPYKSNAKNRVEGILHGYSSTGQTAYIEPKEIIALNNELLSVDDLELRETERLQREWCQLIADNYLELAWLLDRMSYLEIVFAKARFARDHKAVFPSISPEKIDLQEAFNPFLLLKKGKETTVPIKLSTENHIRGIIISGPNAGGKSAALKTLGLFAMMMKFALPVTARKATLPLFHTVLVEMGDHQSLDDELSTFSAHLMALKNILESAKEGALIIIDEIAHATDPIEGEALAAAVVDALLETHAFFAISTHYRRLKDKALSHKEIKLYAAAFDIEYRPLYSLIENAVGESYALKIAERIGIKHKILQNAEQEKIQALDEKEKIMMRLGELEQLLQLKEQDIQRRETDFFKAQENFHEEQKKLEEEKENIRIKGLEAVDHSLNEKLKALSRLQLKEKSDIKNAEIILSHTRNEVNERKRQKNTTKRTSVTSFFIGQTVFVGSLGKDAIVEDIFTHEISLRMGGVKITLPKSDLFEATLPLSKGVSRAIKPSIKAEHSIDLRGKLVSEAIPLLENNLHKALNVGIEEFSIVHGKGTGVLQKVVHEFLKKTPEVESFAFALPQDGGSGKTIVKFK
ncbi:MAG: endonuclease MutS2 [Brevinema sp.]